MIILSHKRPLIALRRTVKFSLMVLSLGLSPLAWSTAQASYQACAACHGDQGQGNSALEAPALAGLQADYLKRQMLAFKHGQRGKQDSQAQQMAAMKGLLSDDRTIAELSAYISKLKPLPAPDKAQLDKQQLQLGYKYYQANCGGCHGGKAEGNKAFSAPALSRLTSAYIQRQLQHFASGKRGNDSRYGKQMQLMANTISDPEILASVLLYIRSQY